MFVALLLLSAGVGRGDWDYNSGTCQQYAAGEYAQTFCGIFAASPGMGVVTGAYSLVGSAGSDAFADASDISSFSPAELGYPYSSFGCDVLRTGYQNGAYYLTVQHGPGVGGYFYADYL
jgi:hypothetical protein